MSSSSSLACSAGRFVENVLGLLLGLCVLLAVGAALLGATTLWLGLLALIAVAERLGAMAKKLRRT